MGLLSKIFSNARKPEGFFGRMMVDSEIVSLLFEDLPPTAWIAP